MRHYATDQHDSLKKSSQPSRSLGCGSFEEDRHFGVIDFQSQAQQKTNTKQQERDFTADNFHSPQLAEPVDPARVTSLNQTPPVTWNRDDATRNRQA